MIRILPSPFGFADALALFLRPRERRSLFAARGIAFLAGVAACFGAPARLPLIAEGPHAVWLLQPVGVFLDAPTMLPLALVPPPLGLFLNAPPPR